MHTTALLLKPLRHLFTLLMEYLLACELLACELRLQLISRPALDKDINQCITIVSAQGEQQCDKLMALVALQLERVRLSAPVIALRLESVLLIDKQTVSGELFSPTVQTSNQLSPKQLVSLLQAKLGQGSVHGLSLQNDHAPEAANRQQCLGAGATGAVKSSAKSLLRPSYLLDPPQPYGESVTIVHGPERIQTHWWQHELARDYYIAKNQQQQWCWLFKQANGDWFIHGYFG